jgi:histidinol-phosphatase (PHP family)
MQPAILANYHTHTPLCHHATGAEEEYIAAALRTGFTVLGFSDHTPWAYATPGYVSRIRMLPEQLEGYVRSLRALREKYAGQLRLYIGLEAEYFPAYMDWLVAQKEHLGIDYLIFGCHYDTTDETGHYFGRSTEAEQILRYAACVVEGMETGAYRYLAHPDLYLHHYPAFDQTAEEVAHTVCRAAARCGLPLEYNLAGLTCRPAGGLGYTTEEFWRVAAQYPVQAIVGCDAHAPEELEQGRAIAQARDFLASLGISVLDTLPGLE